jgi:citrate synthase
MPSDRQETINTRIWYEEPEPDNPFAAAVCRCSGYDVYGDLIKNASFIEYLFLLFKLKPPSNSQSAILEGLAVALANLGPRDHAIRAAMNAGVGGSTHASALIAALSVGAGNLGGAREVFSAMQYWQACSTDIDQWRDYLTDPPQQERLDVWHPMEHPPGFDPNGVSSPKPVVQTLNCLTAVGDSPHLAWLSQNRPELEQFAKSPLAFSGVAAAAFYDLGLLPEQGEMLFLLLRLPGAAVHALEQEKMGWRKYPFFTKGFKVIE